MNYGIYILLITFIVHKDLASAQGNNCTDFGAVWLNSTEPNVGRVNFCNGSQWGTICVDGWDYFDAAVVCRELGYTADGAQPRYYASDENDIIVLKNVDCSWDELRLRDCPYSNYTMTNSCQRAGVRCNIIKNISFATVSNSVLVTWEYNNITSRQPSSFDVRCNGQRHYDNIISVSNGTSRLSDIVGDLLPNASYDCCVSAKYTQPTGAIVTTEIRCASIKSENLLPSDTNNMTASVTNIMISDSNMTATVTVVGAVLGCVIVILLVLLSVCGGALFHLLRSRILRSSEVPKRSATEVAVGRNVSYLGITPSTTSGAQAADTVAGHTPGAATEYSRIGPSYETIANSNHSGRQQLLTSGGNGVSASLSERYEFSEPHLATGREDGGGGGVGQREAAPVEYEIPLQSGEHTEYSHLQR